MIGAPSRSKSGCSQDWLPHVQSDINFPKTDKRADDGDRRLLAVIAKQLEAVEDVLRKAR